ncbi:MAG: HigA family addiction module antitoxin [Alphaproteobacteria bacterium]
MTGFQLQRPPTSPGKVLREEFLDSSEITQDQLAKALNVSRLTVNQLLNEKRAVTAEMAVRLGWVTNTTPDFWLNLQLKMDIWQATSKLSAEYYNLTKLSEL